MFPEKWAGRCKLLDTSFCYRVTEFISWPPGKTPSVCADKQQAVRIYRYSFVVTICFEDLTLTSKSEELNL